MNLRSLFAFLAVVVTTAGTAHADDDTVRLEVDAPKNARLLQRAHGSTNWRTLCVGPCTATVLPWTHADHVVQIESDRLAVHVAPADERPVQHVAVRPRSAAPIGGIVLTVLGGGVATVGVVTIIGGAFEGMSFGWDRGCGHERTSEGQADCKRRNDESDARDDAAAERTMSKGAIILGIGGAAILLGVLLVTSTRPPTVEHRGTKPSAGLRVRLLPSFARMEGGATPASGLAFEVPVVGGTF